MSENIYELAIKKWGKDLQIAIAIEEMAELTKELVKCWRKKEHNVLEELADVEIMINQLKIIFGDTRIMRDQKLIRLAKMLKKEECKNE